MMLNTGSRSSNRELSQGVKNNIRTITATSPASRSSMTLYVATRNPTPNSLRKTQDEQKKRCRKDLDQVRRADLERYIMYTSTVD